MSSPQKTDGIIEQLGLGAWPAERREAFTAQLLDLVQKRVTLRLMDVLSEEDIAQADQFSDDPEAMQKFLMEHAPNLPAIVEEETERVKKELLSEVVEPAAA